MITSKEKAIQIANKELLKQGFDVPEKNITIDERNTLWNRRYLNNLQTRKNNPHIFEKLKGRDYWAIYYTPKEMGKMFGGEAWVFVDKRTGDIIELFYLK